MQTLYTVHTNTNGQVSVDVWSQRHLGFYKWRQYFNVGKKTLARLRRIYRAAPKRFYMTREWSALRWKAYAGWCKTHIAEKDGHGPAVHLTNSQQVNADL
jgi:hypothetical protein